MQYLSKLAERFIKEEDGIVAVEYALVVAIIAGLVAIALPLMNFTGLYTTVAGIVAGLLTP